MTQEDKAKAYDEAIDKVAHFIKKHIGLGCIIHPNSSEAKELFNIFPELKENENEEEIRKDCIKYLDWEYQHCTLDEDKMKIEKCVAWIEKQGEKPQGKSALEAIKEERVDSANKVEQKFKVGDWIVRGKTVAQILEIQEQYYVGLDIDGNDFTSSRFLSDDKIHLWTIRDANEGDVLVTNSNIIFIFKYLDEGGTIAFRASCTENSGVYFPKLKEQLCDQDVYPATKEQRNLLLQKMKEAGYEWDAKKKELSEIKQEPADMVEPKLKIESGKWYVCVRNLLDDYGNRAFCEGDVYLCEKDGFLTPCNSNVPFMLTYCVDTYFRNWDISDAKDGDLIYVSTEVKGIQAIFREYKDKTIFFHCYLCRDFAQDGYMPIGNVELVYPLQKTHYERFFEKMKEAGYEWDADKKELKKIEQKPTWSDEDEHRMNDDVYFIETAKKHYASTVELDACINWIKSLKQRLI